MSLPSKFGVEGNYNPSSAFEDVNDGSYDEFGNIFEDGFDLIKGAVNTVADVTTSIIDRVPGGAEARRAIGDFAKTPAGSFFFRALATVTYQNLAWTALGPQLASVAFAIPGLASGDGFVESWLREFNWRVSQAAGAIPGFDQATAQFSQQVTTILDKYKLGQLGKELTSRAVKELTGFRQDAVDFALSAINKIPWDTWKWSLYDNRTGEKIGIERKLGSVRSRPESELEIERLRGVYPPAFSDFVVMNARIQQYRSGNTAGRIKNDSDLRQALTDLRTPASKIFPYLKDVLKNPKVVGFFDGYTSDDWSAWERDYNAAARKGKTEVVAQPGQLTGGYTWKLPTEMSVASYPPEPPPLTYPTESSGGFAYATQAAPIVEIAPVPSGPMAGDEPPKPSPVIPAAAGGIGLAGALLAGASLPLALGVGLGAGIMGLLFGKKK